MQGAVGDTHRNVLAVAGRADNGSSLVLGPGGSFMTKQIIPLPEDSEWIARGGNHYYLLVSEIGEQVTDTLAPVTEGGGPP